ncbi:hypothetical protein FVP45_12490, partial [Mycobacterium tuberculosis]
LRLGPLALGNHLLDLRQIGLGRQHDLIVADPRSVEHHRVQAVTDGSRRQDLINEVNLLNTKVETRDPNATLRPGSPSNPA